MWVQGVRLRPYYGETGPLLFAEDRMEKPWQHYYPKALSPTPPKPSNSAAEAGMVHGTPEEACNHSEFMGLLHRYCLPGASQDPWMVVASFSPAQITIHLTLQGQSKTLRKCSAKNVTLPKGKASARQRRPHRIIMYKNS